MKKAIRFLECVVVAVAAVALAVPGAHAQCAMCYETAVHAGPEAAKSLDLAILALLSPSLLMFCGILALAYKRRRAPDEDSLPQAR